jgi:hypothetical protein
VLSPPTITLSRVPTRTREELDFPSVGSLKFPTRLEELFHPESPRGTFCPVPSRESVSNLILIGPPRCANLHAGRCGGCAAGRECCQKSGMTCRLPKVSQIWDTSALGLATRVCAKLHTPAHKGRLQISRLSWGSVWVLQWFDRLAPGADPTLVDAACQGHYELYA